MIERSGAAMSSAVAVDEIEMLRWEWTGIDSLASLWSLRGSRPQLIWTPVEELDAFVLNILAPAGHVFWDFSESFQASLAGQARYTMSLNDRPDVTAHLDALCRELETPRASFLSHVVFGGLTRRFGERYFFAGTDDDIFRVAQRHASIGVPSVCVESVSRYFRRQAQVFADRAFRTYDEAAIASGGEESDAARTAISLGAEALPGAARTAAIDWLTQAIGQPGALDAIGLMHACRGANLGLFRTPGADHLDSIGTLLRMRVHAVVEHGTLAALDTMKSALTTPGWDRVEVAELRETLRGLIDTRLHAYPVAQTDPFVA